MNNMVNWSEGPALETLPGGAGPDGLKKVPLTEKPIISQVITTLRRRYKIILIALATALVLGLLLTLLMTPKYTASATLEIQREAGTFVNVQGAEAKESSRDEEFYETQYGLLRAQSLAERVARDLRLDQDPDFMVNVLGRVGATGADQRPRAEKIRLAGEALLRSINVKPGRFSRLVDIEYTDTDPIRAKRVIDYWSTSFVQMTLERRFDATRYARDFLQGRLDQLRQRIDGSERQLVSYAAREGIVNIPSSNGGQTRDTTVSEGERSLVADNLAVLNNELNTASADRIRAESRLAAPRGEVSEALQNTAISSLRERRAEVAADYAKMRAQFESGYPPAQALERQIGELDRAIAREESRVTGTLTEIYKAARAREVALQSRVQQLKGDVIDYRRRNINYEILRREVDTNRQLYDALLQRYKEIGVAGGVGVNNISVIDRAEIPRKPSSPRLFLNLFLALVVGLVAGGGLVILLEQIDQSVEDPLDVERVLGVPMLGAVPKTMDESQVDMIADRKSAISEAYMSVQTILSLATAHGVPRSIGITSSRPAEGKSTTSYALASLFARSKGRVLLIDADMRSPSIHAMLGLVNDRGLSNYLAGNDDMTDLIRHLNGPGLSVITAGPVPPSASELLSTPRFQALLQVLQEDYDHIVVDLPPVMGLADAPLIARRVEGVVFVVEAHVTKLGVAEVALERLNAVKARVFGVLLTKFDPRRSSVGSGYGAAYGYGYGYGYGDTAKGSGKA